MSLLAIPLQPEPAPPATLASPPPAPPAPRYIAIDRNQNRFCSLVVERLIDDDHPARKIWHLLGQLDLSGFEQHVRAVEGHVGRNAHSPRLLIAVWIYAYSRGLHSAREIERQMEYEPALRWLSGLETVNHHTLSDFRVAHGEALHELFVQVLGMLTMQGLITLERVATDGTKIRANVNKKTFTREQKVREHLAVAREHVAELERQEAHEQTTKRQQAARERARREQAERLEEALAEVQKLQAAKKQTKRPPKKEEGGDQAAGIKKEKQKEPQVSITDPQARFMKTSDNGVAPSFNVQVTADGEYGLIVDVEVVNDPQDSQQLIPAMDRTAANCGSDPRQALADGGYTNHESVVAMAERRIDYYGSLTGRTEQLSGRAAQQHPDYERGKFGYDEKRDEKICPEGKRLGHKTTQQLSGGREIKVWAASAADCRACPAQKNCCPGNSLKSHGRTVSEQTVHAAFAEFDEKMQSEAGKAIYKKRGPLIEFPNAWFKEKLKLRRFVTRGLKKVRCETFWAALTYNFQTYFRLQNELAPAG